MITFINYPKCSTCQRAKKYLESNSIDFKSRHIVDDTPTEKELTEIIKKSNLEIKKFFNTSGIKYRQLNLKEKLKDMSDSEKIKLLSSDGMLIKRPILVGDDFVLVGFKENEWNETLLKK